MRGLSWRRRMEMGVGPIAGLLLAGGVMYALYDPNFYTSTTCRSDGECFTHHESLIEHGFGAAAWWLLAGVIALGALFAALSVLHAQTELGPVRYAMWIIAVAAVVVAWFTGLTVGMYILPGALAAIAAAWLAGGTPTSALPAAHAPSA